jgi:hypothetical protein
MVFSLLGVPGWDWEWPLGQKLAVGLTNVTPQSQQKEGSILIKREGLTRYTTRYSIDDTEELNIQMRVIKRGVLSGVDRYLRINSDVAGRYSDYGGRQNEVGIASFYPIDIVYFCIRYSDLL